MPRRRPTEASWDSDEELLEDEIIATPSVITKTTKVAEESDDEELDEAALLGLDDDDDIEVMIQPQTRISTRSSITKEPGPSRRLSSTSQKKPARVPSPLPVKEVKRPVASVKREQTTLVKEEIVTPIAVPKNRVVINKTPVSSEKVAVKIEPKSPVVERKMIVLKKTSPVVTEKPLHVVERKPVVFEKKAEVSRVVKTSPDQVEKNRVLEARKARLSNTPSEVFGTKKAIITTSSTPVTNKPMLVKVKPELQPETRATSVNVAPPKMPVTSVNVQPKRVAITANVPSKTVLTATSENVHVVHVPARTVLAPVNIPPKKITTSVSVAPKIVSTSAKIPPKMISTSVNVAQKETVLTVRRPRSPIRLPVEGEKRDKKPTVISTKIKRPPSPIRMPDVPPVTAMPRTATTTAPGLSVSLKKRLAVPISQNSEPTTGGKIIKLNRANLEPSDRQQSVVPPRSSAQQELFSRLTPAYSHGAMQGLHGQASHLSRASEQDYQLLQMGAELDYEDVLQLDTDDTDAIFLEDGQYTDAFSLDAQVPAYSRQDLDRQPGPEFLAYERQEVQENVPGQAEYHPATQDLQPEASSDSESDKEEGHRGRFTSERSGVVNVAAPTMARGYIPDTLEISDEQQATIDQFMVDGKGRGYSYQRQRGPRRRPITGRQPAQPFLRSQRYPFQSHDQQPPPFPMPGQMQTNFPPPLMFQDQQQQPQQDGYLPGQPLQIPSMHHPSTVVQIQPQYLHQDQQQHQFVGTRVPTPPPLERIDPGPADELDRFLGRPHVASSRPKGREHVHPLDALLATSNQVRPPAPQPLLPTPDVNRSQQPSTILINPHFRGPSAAPSHIVEEARPEQPVMQTYEVRSSHPHGEMRSSHPHGEVRSSHPHGEVRSSHPHGGAHPSFGSPQQQAIQSIGTRQPQLTPEQMRMNFPPPELHVPQFFGGGQGGQIEVIQQQAPPRYGPPPLLPPQHHHQQQQHSQHQSNTIPVQFTSPPNSSSNMMNRQHFQERVVIDPATGQPHQPMQRHVGPSHPHGGYNRGARPQQPNIPGAGPPQVNIRGAGPLQHNIRRAGPHQANIRGAVPQQVNVRGAGPQQAKVPRLAMPNYGGYQRSSTQYHSQQILKRSKQTLMQQQRQNTGAAAIPAIHAQKRMSSDNGTTNAEVPSKIMRVMNRADKQALVQRKERFAQEPHIKVVEPRPRINQTPQVEAQDNISAVASSPVLVAKLEEQKRLREAIIQKKEARREAMADIRRHNLEERLAEQGQTLRDILPAEVKEEPASGIQQKPGPTITPQKQQQQQPARQQSNTQQPGQGQLNKQPVSQSMPAIQRGRQAAGLRGVVRGSVGRGIMGQRGRGQGRGQINAQVAKQPNVQDKADVSSEVARGKGLPLEHPAGLSPGRGSQRPAVQRNTPRGRGFQKQSPRGGRMRGRGGQQPHLQSGPGRGGGVPQQTQPPQSHRGIRQQPPLLNSPPGGLLQHPLQGSPGAGRGFMQRPHSVDLPHSRGLIQENLSGGRPMQPGLIDGQGGRGQGFFQRGFVPHLLQPPTHMNMQGRPRFPPFQRDENNPFRRAGPMENRPRQMGFSQQHLLGNMAHAMNEQLQQQFHHMSRGRAGPPQRMQQFMGRGRPERGGRGPSRYGGPPQSNAGVRANIPSPGKPVKMESVDNKDLGAAVKREASGDASQVKQQDRVVSVTPGSHGDDKRQVLASAGRGSAVPDRTIVVGSGDKCTVSIDNLSSSTSEDSLNQMSSTVGTAQSILLNKQRRHAVVRLSTPAEAQKFLKKYNRYMLDLSHLTVKLVDM